MSRRVSFGLTEQVENDGRAVFATGGTGEGYDFVTVSFDTPFDNTDYDWQYSVGMNTAPDVAPMVWIDLSTLTKTGFVLRTQDQFNGVVKWNASE